MSRVAPLIESYDFEIQKNNFPTHLRKTAKDIYDNGFAVIDFPDNEIRERAERIKYELSKNFDIQHWKEDGHAKGIGLRLIDEWKNNDDVFKIATNEIILHMLETLYGRKPFPFQTLNFPVGTQQHFHADTFHFNTLPERWMCGVWVALEDIDDKNGPLVYYPGTHKWPVLWREHLGIDLHSTHSIGQNKFDEYWSEAVAASGVKPNYFHCKKGQALIWTANLLHGGSKQIDSTRTRWSQVTHYYFEDCTYWRPFASNLSMGNIFTFNPPNLLLNRPYSISDVTRSKLPVDFDPKVYKDLNNDLFGLSEDHAAEHYVFTGNREGRRYI